MYLIVNLNPAVDRIYTLSDFQLNKIHRVSNFLAQAGGKGINVARACKTLKGNSIVSGITGGYAGQFILNNLKTSGIDYDFHMIDQESRTCTIIIDPDRATQTVINEDGPAYSDESIDTYIQNFSASIERYNLLVLSGSIPASLKYNVYAELISIAAEKGIPAIVDTSKLALQQAIEATPFMIKPNIFELSEALNKPRLVDEAMNEQYKPLIQAAQTLIHNGTQNVTVSMGKHGAFFCNKDKAFRVKAPLIKEVNAVASGDSMTAAMAMELDAGKTLEEAVVSGVAAGSANAEVGGLRFTYEQYAAIRQKLSVEYLE
jgi:1-phosphofructokinase family hexose kinase